MWLCVSYWSLITETMHVFKSDAPTVYYFAKTLLIKRENHRLKRILTHKVQRVTGHECPEGE